ncbi:hypothetical protein JM946_09675 [Steroidobacter sp. S1-65]|uniref:HTH cro/C1-type domain-containing protein n=1 Tax=Steroidobacter gossypii TaxID=2805490 RepID=A0ABS1WVL4_9GAMM|nr:helix-turn-helix domain-containing protein [Steroidobacter gossypii]MBM0105019.1 hypothetical protein [Steroidobacter gossypii]
MTTRATLRTIVPISPFAAALRGLLDRTGLFTRAEWARVLGISTAALSQWVNDRTLPRAELLRQIVDIVRNADGVPPEPLADFEELSQQPADHVSPLGQRMLPNVSAYLRGGRLSQLGSELRKLTPSEQRSFLEDGSWPATATITVANTAPTAPDVQRRQEGMDIALLPPVERDTAHDGRRERLSWDTVLGAPRVVIQGGPGAGKTLVMRTLAKVLQESEGSTVKMVNAADLWGETSTSSVAEACESGPLCLLLDGLDEVGFEYRHVATREIAEAAQRFEGVRMIIATRPIPELPELQGFEWMSLAPLTDLQMVLWIEHMFHSANRFRAMEELELFLCQLAERESLRDNAKSPLFLSIATKLFETNAVTPFSETEILGEYLRVLLGGWGREKKVVRARKPWALPHKLLADLATLCFHLLAEERTEFNTADASRWLKCEAGDDGMMQLLPLLSIKSGVFRDIGEGRWRVMRQYFVSYLAAVHAVGRSADVIRRLRRLEQHDAVPDVFRLACGISDDATSLLRYMIHDYRESEAERSMLLFEALAQPIVAKQTVFEAAYAFALRWLDNTCARLRVVGTDEGDTVDRRALWKLRASGRLGGEDVREYLLRALRAIYRARSGPARDFLAEQLKSRCRLLAEFSGSMVVEGRLHIELHPGPRSDALSVSVVTPQLD